MPVPNRKVGEDRNEFVSRCIKEMNDKDSNMDQDQIIAICENQADMSAFSTWDEIRAQMQIKKDLSPDKRYKNNK